jgi:hypothetical protein
MLLVLRKKTCSLKIYQRHSVEIGGRWVNTSALFTTSIREMKKSDGDEGCLVVVLRGMTLSVNVLVPNTTSNLCP